MSKAQLFNNVPRWENGLTPEIQKRVNQLVDEVLSATQSAKLPREVEDHWDGLIEKWINRVDLPLYIRKQSNEKGNTLIHQETGRKLVPCDNSPAQWVMVMAYEQGDSYSFLNLEAAIRNEQIPVAMITPKERSLAKHPKFNTSNYGWRVDHLDDVGLKMRERMENIGVDVLEGHFRRLLKPSNMVLTPSCLKGIGEMPTYIQRVMACRP